ncbi:mycofactocin biosynthesis glycosyltransferase MftF [Actinokineospora sp.]|uniref:mycofactocin biosynthesis glycosyltransferase MftF n=1 Tax=Actinokineospora sp. TaxID=1872133 RepID=UPI004037BFF7
MSVDRRTAVALSAGARQRDGANPSAVPPPTRTRLPEGFRVRIAADARTSSNGRLVLGGSPARLFRFSPRAAALMAAGEVTVRCAASRALARVLVDAGIAHPRPGPLPAGATIVIPAHSRQSQVDRLLAALRADPETAAIQVVVVDDASPVPLTALGATVVRHERNRGPAAARNTGLACAGTEFVVFCDSDVVPCPGWLAPLLAQFADPAVALAAPRIVSLATGSGVLSRYERVRSPLDLGPREAPIVPMSPVAYVPGAALVVRRAAVGAGFAADLRVAEDVDLCLRLHEAGWRLRYVPTARVAHDHRTTLADWVRQRVRYGSGAAVLAQRHPGSVAPLHLAPWAVAACLSLVDRRVLPAAVLTAVAAGRLARRMPDADTPVRAGVRLAVAAVRGTAEQLGNAATRHHWPIAVPLALVDRRARWVLAAAVVVGGVRDHRKSGSTLPLPAHIGVRVLDDLAYGAGLWLGAIRARTAAPLLPRVSWRRAK